jgi:uncharacterized protein (DUF2141 family)
MSYLSWSKKAGVVLVLCIVTAIASQAQNFRFFSQRGAGAAEVTAPRLGALPMPGLGFAPVVDYDSGGDYAYSVAVADVNGDGRPDLLITNFCTGVPNCHGTVSVLLGNGEGTFQTAVTYESGGFWAYAVAVADVNGDGKPDLLVENLCPNSGNCNGGAVGVLLGNGDGTFQAAVSYGSGGYVPQCCGSYSLAVADVNGDGRLDVLVANPCEGVGCSDGANGTVGVLLGNGDGTFQTAVTYGSGGIYATSVAVADVNADGTRPAGGERVREQQLRSEQWYCRCSLGKWRRNLPIRSGIRYGRDTSELGRGRGCKRGRQARPGGGECQRVRRLQLHRDDRRAPR